MMNFANKAAFSIPKTNLFQLQVALFHSSPVLERKRRNFCDASHRSNNRFKNYSRRSRRLNANEALLRNIGAYADHLFQSHRSNNYSRRSNRLNAKEALLCNISSYVDHLFQSWHDGFDQEDPSSSSGPSWFRQQYTKGSRRGMNDNQRTTSSSKKGFQFCEEDDVDVDNIFRSTFGGNRYFHWSFVNDENPQWKNSSGYYSYSYGKNQRYRVEDEYDCSSESDHDGSEPNFASDRLALGLRAYGPLKLEDVKNAYRSCALKWHPDRHQGSSKSWHDGDQEDPSSSSGPSWFRQQYTKGSRRGMNDNQRTTSSSKKGFHFCEEDDVDVDNIFRSTFGGNRYFHWSFVNDENPQWKNSSGYYSYSYGKNQRYRVEDEYDCSSESDHDGSESNFASDRLALGLRAYGPLKLEDVKNAYRSCALKWHPDRHQGSSKAVAEEKFKLCSAAYQSLCDKLTAA